MLTDGKDYRAKDAEKIKLTVEKSAIINADFITTLTPPTDSGSIVLTCDVIHPLGEGADARYHEFNFDVSYADITDTVTLRHGESRILKDIPIGAEVTLTQTDVPAGFTSDKDKLTLSIDKAGIYLANFVNTYSPKAVSAANVSLTGDIELTGRELLNGDRFTYRLQRFNGTGWDDMAELSATKDKPDFDFTSYISAESFNTPGVYSYRVMPVIAENPHNGINFDKMVRWFEMIVTDNNWDGSYEISSIVGFNGGIVAKNNNKWQLHANFFSDYKVTGSGAVSIVVDTVVQGREHTALDGFIYGLYQNGKLVQTLPASDINGESVLSLSYSVADIGNSIDYTVKQIIPDTPLSDMAYSDKEYKLTVKIEDDLMGNVKASITSEGKTSREAHLTFINEYLPTVSDNDTTDTDKVIKDTTTVKQDKDTKPVSPGSTSPMTGDNGIVFWGILLLASAAIIVIIICTKKRKTVN